MAILLTPFRIKRDKNVQNTAHDDNSSTKLGFILKNMNDVSIVSFMGSRCLSLIRDEVNTGSRLVRPQVIFFIESKEIGLTI